MLLAKNMDLCEGEAFTSTYHMTSDRFIITISDGMDEYALGLSPDEMVDLTDYECRAITMKEMPKVRALAKKWPDYNLIAEILERGFEVHIWRHKTH